MTISKAGIFGLALSGLLLLGADARATSVTYTTTGTFDGGDLGGTSTYLDAANGIEIDFLSALNSTVTVPPASLTSFGQFDTSNTTASAFASVSSGFTLSIFQTSPSPGGSLNFVGSLSGQLRTNNSQAFVLFSGPLSQSIGSVVYSIVNADSGTPGRVSIAPPTTNSGLTTVNGQINAVPEPSTVVLLGMGAAVPFVLTIRRKRRLVAA